MSLLSYNKNNTNCPQRITFLLIFCLLVSSTVKGQLAIEVHTAKKIYTSEIGNDTVECFATQGSNIIFTGTIQEAKARYPKAKNIQHIGYLYPGFFDAHCHFLAYARGTKELNVFGITSKHKIAKMAKKFAKKNKRDWVVGRGWDQNLWGGEFPEAQDLDAAVKTKPVCISRVDGHAVWVNSKAIEVLKLNLDTQIIGGEIVRNKEGKPTGVFIDNAADWIKDQIPPMSETDLTEAVESSLKMAYANGLTTIDEAGLSFKEIQFIKKLQDQGKWKLRVYAMVAFNENALGEIINNKVQFGDPNLNVRSAKIYLDGALGSRGALLKHDYCDRHGHKGLQLIASKDFEGYCSILFQTGMQVCVHAIGDSANAIALRTFKKVLPADYDARWRIEHAQIVSPKDMSILKSRSIIPSVQPTHATSDAPWALSRICASNPTQKYNPVFGAYAYKDLLKFAPYVALGTDFPVENISSLATFYSATRRKDLEGNLKEPFLPAQALSPLQTLYGMTIWAAQANFEETLKGSISTGKYADFIEINTDIITCSDAQFKKAKITRTYIGGQLVWK